jgi:hypothetical protein
MKLVHLKSQILNSCKKGKIFKIFLCMCIFIVFCTVFASNLVPKNLVRVYFDGMFLWIKEC